MITVSQEKSYTSGDDGSSFDLDSYHPLSVTNQLRGSILRRVRTGQPVLPDINGREETKADVLRALLSGAHPYLVSEEGTGKTRLAKSLTKLLPRVPVIKGCPYRDDPKWPQERLCPRCRASQDPVKEFGIELISGALRFSRIQGNEYTNEAKLLGLKDIQAIAHGKSPSDPEVFTGTGVFHANRGILFIDELPAIRTKVQVLLHPILEEGKAILEEYNWEHLLDLVLIATGNPQGFSHVNEIPRPLLDRLELIYMGLPDEDVERDIMLHEAFQVNNDLATGTSDEPPYPRLEDIERRVITPWWIIDILNKAVRYSRICPYIEKRPSIRATYRSLDHTCASVELDNRRIANLRHAYHGLKLALRGRVGLRADLIDFDRPEKALKLTEELSADFMWNAFEDMRGNGGYLEDCDKAQLSHELASLVSSDINLACEKLPWAAISPYSELSTQVSLLVQANHSNDKQHSGELSISAPPQAINDNEEAEINYSAVEVLANLCVHSGVLDEYHTGPLFIPQKYRS